MSLLYVTDLDGTLLHSDGELSDWSHSRLRALLEDGIPLTVASARSAFSIQEKLRGLPIQLPIIECNGAFLTDLKSGRHIGVWPMASTTAYTIHDYFMEQSAVMFMTTTTGERDAVYYGDRRNGGLDWFIEDRLKVGDPRPRYAPDFIQALGEQVACITAVGSEAEMHAYERELDSIFGNELTMHVWDDPYAKDWWWLMIHDRQACKGQAMKRLIQHVQGKEAPEQARAVVFGDQVNDLGLFEHATERIAVENACPELKEIATEVIAHHDQDPVVNYLEKSWNEEKKE
ncbi:MAG: HAD-IIB family hydrolase [Verrucomicrobiota bacterium]